MSYLQFDISLPPPDASDLSQHLATLQQHREALKRRGRIGKQAFALFLTLAWICFGVLWYARVLSDPLWYSMAFAVGTLAGFAIMAIFQAPFSTQFFVAIAIPVSLSLSLYFPFDMPADPNINFAVLGCAIADTIWLPLLVYWTIKIRSPLESLRADFAELRPLQPETHAYECKEFVKLCEKSEAVRRYQNALAKEKRLPVYGEYLAANAFVGNAPAHDAAARLLTAI